MHLNSCCALFLLALVACQAAPSPKGAIEKSVSEAETFAKNDIQLEDTGAEKDRAKKSATTFCVEVRSGKPEQVPCRPQEVRPQRLQGESKPVVIVQPIPISAPVLPPYEFPREPVVIKTQPPQPQPPQNYNVIQQQQSSTNVQPQPQVVQTPQPTPAPAAVPAPPPTSIINIVPSAPTSEPCNKQPTIVQPQQPQQIHTIHHVIHPQQTPRPSVTVIQEVKPQKQVVPQQILPMPQPEFTVYKKQVKVPCVNCKGQASSSYVIQPSTTYVNVPQATDKCSAQEETYECNCRPESRIPTLTPYLTRYPVSKIQEPRSNIMMAYPDDMPIESMHMMQHSMQPSMRSSMRPSMLTENDLSMMSDQPVFFVPSEETNREAV